MHKFWLITALTFEGLLVVSWHLQAPSWLIYSNAVKAHLVSDPRK